VRHSTNVETLAPAGTSPPLPPATLLGIGEYPAHVAREIPATRGGELDPATQRVFVGQLRKKLGDDAADPRLIVTHFGMGYRWIAGTGAADA
jgi:hypothetical protein